VGIAILAVRSRRQGVRAVLAWLLTAWVASSCKEEGASSGEASPDAYEPPAAPGRTSDAATPAPSPEARSGELRVPKTVDEVGGLGFGKSTRKMHVVGSARDLLDALDDDTTIVLLPGEYRIGGKHGVDAAALSAKLVGRDNLELVGIGTPPPGLLQLEFEEPGLRLDRVSNVKIYNLSIGHEGTCMAPALAVLESSDVSAIAVDLYGSGTEGIKVISSTRVEIGRCRIHDCSHRLSTIEDSVDVVVRDCVVEDNAGLMEGLRMFGSVVEFRDVDFRRNVLHKTQESELFPIDTGRSAPYLSGPRIPSRIRFERVNISENAFSSLSNAPEQLEQLDSSVAPGQFRNDRPSDDEPWWCGCHRLADEEASAATHCWETRGACVRFEDEILGSVSPPELLAAGLMQRCRHIGNVTFGTGQRAPREDGLMMRDGCHIPPPRTPGAIKRAPELSASLDPLPTGATKVWESLAPFLRVDGVGKTTSVSVPPRDVQLFDQLSWDGLRRRRMISATDSLLPPELLDLRPPVLVTADGFELLSAFSSVRFERNGSARAWVLEYDQKSSRPAIAIGAPPHPDARLRTETSYESAALDHWAVALARRMFSEDPIVLPVREHSSWAVRTMVGRFPRGATRVVMMMGGEHVSDRYGVAFTVNADAEVVQFVHQGGNLRLDALVDLDGDGYDEILLTDADSAGYTHRLIRLTDSSRTDIKLSQPVD
jgi:hypothetical protein